MRLAQTLVKAAVILALIAATLGGAVALGSTLFEPPPRDAAEFAARVEAGSTHAPPAVKHTAAERQYILAVTEMCAERNERLRKLDARVNTADKVGTLRGWRAIQADFAADFEALAPPRLFRETAMRAMALDRSMLALSTDALVAHDSGDIDGFDAKAEAVALLDQQADEAMIRLEAPVCAAL